jgi:hypothetical protein
MTRCSFSPKCSSLMRGAAKAEEPLCLKARGPVDDEIELVDEDRGIEAERADRVGEFPHMRGDLADLARRHRRVFERNERQVRSLRGG